MKRGLTLPEALLAGVVTGTVLLLVAVWIAGVRDDLKRQQVAELFRQLDAALDAYRNTTHSWPTDAQILHVAYQSDQYVGSGDRVIALLGSLEGSLAALNRIPPPLRTVSEGGNAEGSSVVIRDAWGQSLRCYTGAGESPADREAVAANRGRPIFISGGPDGDFGDADPAAAADNIRSDGR